MSNFMKIRPVGPELYHAGRRTGRHDEANGRFWQYCEHALKIRSPNPSVVKRAHMIEYNINFNGSNTKQLPHLHKLSQEQSTIFVTRINQTPIVKCQFFFCNLAPSVLGVAFSSYPLKFGIHVFAY